MHNLLNLPTVGANHAKFAQFASISQGSLYPRAKLPKLATIRALGKLCKFRRPFSDSHHGKWNSQNLQQIAQNLLNLPTVGANHAKFAQFASISQGSLYPWVELSNFTIFMYLCNFVDFSFKALVRWNPDQALAYDANIATLSYNWRSINFVYILVTLYSLTFRSIQVL